MGCKYMIHCANYPYEGIWSGSYQTNSMIKAIYYLIKAKLKYEIIDFEVRDFNN